ncbi:MAG: tetratricopeptide repeat protein [Pyrinomonadaceae bacterium]|nr:tetratricopeptide repeat protein [Pyrinomonadaceae bacterium]
MKVIIFSLCFGLLGLGLAQTTRAQVQTANSSASTTDGGGATQPDRLNGLVRRVRVETVSLLVKKGITVEGPRVVREITTYDLKGQKIDSITYPAEDRRLVGNKQYVRDAKGYIVEMLLRGDDGSIINKERYDYQFDEFGNWKQMTASIAVYENGKVDYEPFEITYRTIGYYYGQPAPRVITAPTAMPISNTSTTETAHAPSQVTRPPIDASIRAAGTGLTPVEVKKASSVAEAAIVKPEKSEPSIETPAPKNDASKVPVMRVSEEVPRKAALDLPQPHQSAASPATKGTSSELQTSQLNQGISDIKILHPGDLEANAKPATASPAPAPSLYDKGLELLASGRNSEAAEALKKATERDPNDGAAYAKLGIAYAALKQYQEAVVVLKMAIKIKPEIVDAEAYFELSNAYTALEKFSNALEAIKQATYVRRAELANSEVANPLRSLSLEDLHYSTGLAYFNLRRYSEAIEELKQVIAQNPKRAQAHYGLALSYLASGNRRSAEKQQATLEALDPVFAAKIAKLLSSTTNQQQGFGFVFKTSP